MTGRNKQTGYVLMNKDVPMLSFLCERNEFDEPVFRELFWCVAYRPIGYKSLISFLEKRRALAYRPHIHQILDQYGEGDLEAFIEATHAVSLNDTFWIKADECDLCWGQVSPYRNEFDMKIAHAAFNGLGDPGHISISPEFCTDGSYPKCWVRKGEDIFLYKAGKSRNVMAPLSEYLACQVAKILCLDFVGYELDKYRGKHITKCWLFTSEQYGLAKATDVFQERRTIPDLLRYFEKLGSGDAFRRMCVLDAVILNTDRHYGNFGIVFNTETMKPMSMSPVYDHNRSLFSELNQEQLERPEWFIEHSRPKLGKNLITNARGLLTPEIRADLRNLMGFQFHQHESIEAPQERLDALSEIVNGQIKAILE